MASKDKTKYLNRSKTAVPLSYTWPISPFVLIFFFLSLIFASSFAAACRHAEDSIDKPKVSPRNYDLKSWTKDRKGSNWVKTGEYEMVNTDKLVVAFRYCNQFHFKATIQSSKKRTLNHMAVMLSKVFNEFSPVKAQFRYKLDKIITESFANEMNRNRHAERVSLPRDFIVSGKVQYRFVFNRARDTATFYFSRLD